MLFFNAEHNMITLNKEAVLIGLSLIVGLVFSANASAETSEVINNTNTANFQDFFTHFFEMLISLFKFS